MIERAGAALHARRKEADAFYVWTNGQDTAHELANAIAIRLGDAPRSEWTTDLLGTLAARVARR